jgi:hypothetical protein
VHAAVLTFKSMETNAAEAGVGARPEWPSGGVIERLADRLAKTDAQTVYGNPIERDGLTIIPVAKVRYGFGGGTGRKQAAGQEGTGAGGGVNVTPVGFIEMGKDGVRFRRIRTTPPALLALGIGLGVWLLSRALSSARS